MGLPDEGFTLLLIVFFLLMGNTRRHEEQKTFFLSWVVQNRLMKLGYGLDEWMDGIGITSHWNVNRQEKRWKGLFDIGGE